MGRFIVGGVTLGINGTGNASNGLSVDPGTGDIVLGNNTGDLAMPAILLSDREISTNGGNRIDLVDDVAVTTRLRLTDQRVILDRLLAPLANIFMELNGTTPQWQAFGVDATFSVGNANSSVSGQSNGLRPYVELQNPTGDFRLELVLGVLRIRTASATGNGLNMDGVGDDVASTGTLSTSNPGGGIGKMKFGKVIVAPVVFDATRYIEQEVDGVTVKVLIGI